jgi:hypothetical protein
MARRGSGRSDRRQSLLFSDIERTLGTRLGLSRILKMAAPISIIVRAIWQRQRAVKRVICGMKVSEREPLA